jgi:hypothetical protein
VRRLLSYSYLWQHGAPWSMVCHTTEDTIITRSSVTTYLAISSSEHSMDDDRRLLQLITHSHHLSEQAGRLEQEILGLLDSSDDRINDDSRLLQLISESHHLSEEIRRLHQEILTLLEHQSEARRTEERGTKSRSRSKRFFFLDHICIITLQQSIVLLRTNTTSFPTVNLLHLPSLSM